MRDRHLQNPAPASLSLKKILQWKKDHKIMRPSYLSAVKQICTRTAALGSMHMWHACDMVSKLTHTHFFFSNNPKGFGEAKWAEEHGRKTSSSGIHIVSLKCQGCPLRVKVCTKSRPFLRTSPHSQNSCSLPRLSTTLVWLIHPPPTPTRVAR